MDDPISVTLPLARWQGERGTYHLVTLTGSEAEAIATHAAISRFEFGRARGFGSVKVVVRIGETRWKTSVFPQKKSREWVLLISQKVMRAENLAAGDPVELLLELL